MIILKPPVQGTSHDSARGMLNSFPLRPLATDSELPALLRQTHELSEVRYE